MLDLKDIESFYPEREQPFKRNILTEYLQYKIVETIFDSEYGGKLVFMGGTAIRMVYGSDRFSEDLDFDNHGITAEDFKELTTMISKSLELEGYQVESRIVSDGVFRAYFKIGEVLYNFGLSGHREEKLTIQVDTEPQDFAYEPDKRILNKFDVFTRVNVIPLDVLLAQKLTAIFTRPRALGRDFYDAVFLLGCTSPNLQYLVEKVKIKSAVSLKRELLLKTKSLDMEALANDVQPFLVDPSDVKKVLYFREYIEKLEVL